MISLKTMSRAVSCESAPFMCTVRCRTVAKALSIGFDVRRCVQCSVGKSKKRQQCVAVPEKAIDGLVVLGRAFLGEGRHRGGGDSAVFGEPDFAHPDARWAEPTSAACRERSGSCAASIVGDGRGKGFVQGLRKAERPVAHRDVRRDRQTPAPLDRQAVPSSSGRFPACPSASPATSFLPSGVAPISTRNEFRLRLHARLR